jgi:hypothetical protein
MFYIDIHIDPRKTRSSIFQGINLLLEELEGREENSIYKT